MKFNIDKTLLNDSIKKVSRAISTKVTIPQLSGILVQATNDNLILTASDSNLSIRLFVPNDKENGLEILEQGSAIFPAREFSSIARALPNSLIKIEVFDKLQAEITSGKSNFKLHVMNGDDYPRLKDVKGEGFTIKGEEFTKLINSTVYAVSKTETRPILTGINLCFRNDQISVIATDAHRLSKMTLNSKIDGKLPEGNITIPGDSLKKITSIIDSEENVTITKNTNQIILKSGDLMIFSRLLDGNYPETDRLIPNDYKTVLEVNQKSFLASIERSAILADGDQQVVVLKISNKNKGIFDTIELSHTRNELGQSKEDIVVNNIEGEEVTLSFNPTYMIDALKVIDSDEVIIEFNGSMRPFVLKPKNTNNFIQLILPMRTY